jgi:16S rRNA (guanine527-N7)-methyltransferase
VPGDASASHDYQARQLDPAGWRRLQPVLQDAQALGFIGPGDLEPHIGRAEHMGALLPAGARRVLDLGSGGGLPGLPLALIFDQAEWILLEGGTTRAGFLVDAVDRLGLTGRVSVVGMRAEDAGRQAWRGTQDCVVSRSFGPPAVTAECAAPFLRVGGRLIVAEPPAGDTPNSRWAAGGLDRLGMALGPALATPSAVQALEQVRLCPAAYPRRNGVPAKRPLF